MLIFYLLGHLLVSTSNAHTTRFWARDRFDAAASVCPGRHLAATAGPGDDGESKAEDGDDALAVPGVGTPASVTGTSWGDASWNSADTTGSAHGGVGSSTDTDVVPGLGEGEVPGFGRQKRKREWVHG